MQRVERFVEIDAPVELVFDRFSDFESFPRWMRNIREVRRTGRRMTHWVRETAVSDVYAEWDAELTVFEPDHRIVWRSVRGDIRADGEAVISETAEGTTLLHVVVGYGTPLGRSGAQAERFYGANPGRQLEEDLERFRRLAEGEARERRRAGVRRRQQQQRATFAPVMSRRDEARRGAEDDGGRVPSMAREASAGRGASGPLEATKGREELRRHDEGEDVRRPVRAASSEEEARRRGELISRDEAGGEREYSPRYALTPRERERDRDEYERRFDPRVAEMFGRRGVDRLLDAPREGRRRRGDEGGR
jgi:uncharacterized membrane protein